MLSKDAFRGLDDADLVEKVVGRRSLFRRRHTDVIDGPPNSCAVGCWVKDASSVVCDVDSVEKWYEWVSLCL